ncbi:MAG: hypothetical protein ABFR19_09490, partial [Pseudomonadota bacterium]
VTVQHLVISADKSLLLGVSGGNVGGVDADASLHGSNYGVFRKIYPIAATFSIVLNSYLFLMDALIELLRAPIRTPFPLIHSELP